GAGTMRCHRSRRIESRQSRKSPPIATSASPVAYRAWHDRSDHSTHRELPLPTWAAGRRAPEPRLHALPCRLRCAGRAAAPDRAGRSRRGALLVALEATMGQRRSIRAHRHDHRPRPPVHRIRGHLLGSRLVVAPPEKCGKSSLEAIEIIRLYGLRFKIEHTFKQAARLIGSFTYHFWMSDMKPLRRRNGDQHLHRASPEYRNAVKRKLH